MAREPRAATLYSVGPAWGPDHEAAIRFSGKAPGQRAHSSDGIKAMAHLVSPPPRIVINSRPRMRDRSSKLFVLPSRLSHSGHRPQHDALWHGTGRDHAP